MRPARGAFWPLLAEGWGANPALLPPSAGRREFSIFLEEGSGRREVRRPCPEGDACRGRSTSKGELEEAEPYPTKGGLGLPSFLLTLESRRRHQFLPG